MSADIRTRALACLARRDYSRAELRRKLLGETADIDQLDSTLDALERDGFLSDARFAEHLVAQRRAFWRAQDHRRTEAARSGRSAIGCAERAIARVRACARPRRLAKKVRFSAKNAR